MENKSFNFGNPLLDRDNFENAKEQPSKYLVHYKQSDSQKFDSVKELKNGTNKVKEIFNPKNLPNREKFNYNNVRFALK